MRTLILASALVAALAMPAAAQWNGRGGHWGHGWHGGGWHGGGWHGGWHRHGWGGRRCWVNPWGRWVCRW
jgi:Spy/CpxP family protein refolding chaperone